MTARTHKIRHLEITNLVIGQAENYVNKIKNNGIFWGGGGVGVLQQEDKTVVLLFSHNYVSR